ncbi:transposase [Intestinimonas sp.]|uniref:IS110 family transposase n=1 Tax=Intestinimonas sp. TaxID=1965293 RepID=UPI002603FE5D|nr:transposase [Intestinimonas sp.]
MEATGHDWLSVYGYLLDHGFEVKVINPIQSEAFRKMYIRQTKNDRQLYHDHSRYRGHPSLRCPQQAGRLCRAGRAGHAVR